MEKIKGLGFLEATLTVEEQHRLDCCWQTTITG